MIPKNRKRLPVILEVLFAYKSRCGKKYDGFIEKKSRSLIVVFE